MLRDPNYLKISKSDTYIIVMVMYNMQDIGYDTKRTYTQEHGDLAMNSNVIGFIEDIVGKLGDVEDGQRNSWIAQECAEELFALIKPFLNTDIKTGDEHLG